MRTIRPSRSVRALEALDHPRRQRLLAVLRAAPGIHFRDVARRSGLATGTARHHLNVLVRHGFVVERRHGQTTRFVDGSAAQGSWTETVLLREPALATLHGWLRLNPRSSQRRVLEAMGERGWPRSTTQHRLLRLVDAGLATVFLHGRLKLHSTTQGRETEASPMEAVHAFA